MVQLILLCVLLLGSVSSSWAATYYVSTSGNNANVGSEALPWRTLTYAAATMLPGDTTYARGGTYVEATIVRFGRVGTQANPIKLLNYPGETPVLQCGVTTNIGVQIQNYSGETISIAWITVEGFEIHSCSPGIKFTNLADGVIRHNYIHDTNSHAILGVGGLRVLIEKNILKRNGRFAACAADATICNKDHGIYINGSHISILGNVIYDSLAQGIQLKGTVDGTSTYYPSPDYGRSHNWIIANNTIAYTANRGGLVVWGTNVNGLRIENNIFYENCTECATTSSQGIAWTSASTGSHTIQIRNNHFYATGSGAQVGITSGQPLNTTTTGNVTNVSSPGFVNGGTNLLPASPDFRLAASTSPAIGMALANEFARNASLTVGAFDTVGSPLGSITSNTATLILPMSGSVPVQNLSAMGVTFACTGANCPGGGLTASGVSRVVGTDTHVATTIAGFAGNACVAANQAVTQSYDAATGTWTGNDHIGPHPGLHQKIFSFTNVALTNQCTGAGPAVYPVGYHIYYKFNEGTGTNANDESLNNLDCTLTSGATWGTGKTGTGLAVASGTLQHCAVPWGSGVDPTTQDITIFIPIYVQAGTESAQHLFAGPDLGTNQRAYPCAHGGTWKVSLEAVPCSSRAASNLSVTAGWNLITLRFDSTTNTATIYKDTTAGTGGATGTYTMTAFASNWKIGRLGTSTTTSNYVFDDFLVYLSLEDPADLVAAFEGTIPPAVVGTLAQAAVQFQGVTLDATGNVISFGALNSTQEVVANGGVAVVFQVHCQNIADCDSTAFKLVFAKNQTAAAARAASSYITTPNTETTDGFYFWGSTTAALNNGVTTTRLTGSCAVTTGSTQLNADQVPTVDLPQDGCVMLRYLVRVGNMAGSYYEPFLVSESGLVFAGGYVDGRITVVNPRASGIGF